jgi:uncharacterized protein
MRAKDCAGLGEDARSGWAVGGVKGVMDGFECRLTPDRGIGVFAIRMFARDETVLRGAALIRVDQNSSHAVQVGVESFAYEDGPGSFVNHSCEPNCGARLTAKGRYDLIARRRIDCGQEITIDYALRNYVVEFFPDRCLCGVPSCRGRITGWQDLPPVEREKHTQWAAPFLLEGTYVHPTTRDGVADILDVDRTLSGCAVAAISVPSTP